MSTIRYVWEQAKPFLVRIFLGNPLRKFFTAVFSAGVLLVSPSFLGWVLEVLVTAFGYPSPQPKSTTFSEHIGALLIAVGIVGNILLYLIEKVSDCRRRERKERERFGRTIAATKKTANKLAGLLRFIAREYEDETISKEGGHCAEKKLQASKLAKNLEADENWCAVSNPKFHTVCDPPICTSGIYPYFNTTSGDLKLLADQIEGMAKEL